MSECGLPHHHILARPRGFTTAHRFAVSGACVRWELWRDSGIAVFAVEL
ncbi:hypothetical protein [Nocardia fluminea]